MAVVGKRIGECLSSHGQHRDAIGKAVSFVWPRPVKFESIQKRGVRLRHNADNFGVENIPGCQSGFDSQPGIGCAKCQELNENFISCYDDPGTQGPIELQRLIM